MRTGNLCVLIGLISGLLPVPLLAQMNSETQQIQFVAQEPNQDSIKEENPKQSTKRFTMVRKGSPPVHKYAGLSQCQACHSTKEIGDQYGIWAKSKHADAYADLASKKAIKIGKELGIEKPHESGQCLICHVTAYDKPSSVKAPSFDQSEGVGCEACHGAGSDYMALEIMQDREKAVKAGMVIPNEQTCLGCHNENSPTYKEFDFAKFSRKIAHPVTGKAESK